jgi:hypothetical protein
MPEKGTTPLQAFIRSRPLKLLIREAAHSEERNTSNEAKRAFTAEISTFRHVRCRNAEALERGWLDSDHSIYLTLQEVRGPATYKTGYYAGLFLGAALNYPVGAHFGWQAMFLCGSLPVVVSLHTEARLFLP